MAIRNSIKKAQKRPDSITKGTKMKATKSINSMIAKRRKATIRNTVANMNSMIQRKVTTRKAKNMILATMKDIKVNNTT